MIPAPAEPRQGATARFGSLDWFDWLVLAATAALSTCVLVPLLVKGHTVTGGDGLYPVDQLQYLAWIRQASEHGLIANRFDMLPDTRVFLHPAFFTSGLVHGVLGIPIAASNALVWKPVAILVVFFGVRQYVRRLLPVGWPARSALLLGIFVLLPMSLILKALGAGHKVRYNLDFITSEMWPGQQLLGYEVAAVAIFSVPLLLLAVEKARGGGRPGLIALCALGAMFVMWLQPWQGVELLLIVAGVELWRWWRHSVRPNWSLTVLAAAGALPAFYYAVLQRTDPSWELYGKTNSSTADPIWDWSWWAVAICIAPFIVAGLGALKRANGDWQETAVRIWPIAVLIVYLQPFGTFPFHSIQGLSIPLAVLAVQGLTVWRPSRIPSPRWWWVAPLLLVAIVPGTVHRLSMARENIVNRTFPYALEPGEVEALTYLESDPTPGGVIGDAYGGLLLPAFAGRESYIGTRALTPDFANRTNLINRMMMGAYFVKASGKPPLPATVRDSLAFVRGSGARFIFVECGGWKGGAPDLMPMIGVLVERHYRFGCSRVYRLKETAASRRLSVRLGSADGP